MEEKSLTFFQQNSLKQRVLVSQHQALVCCGTVALLQSMQRVLLSLYGGLQLLDIFCPPLSESRLSLTVPLLSFLRGGVYLVMGHAIFQVGYRCYLLVSSHLFASVLGRPASATHGHRPLLRHRSLQWSLMKKQMRLWIETLPLV